MSNSDPVLTIGIPTWKRKNELRRCLEIVLPQAKVEEAVEVLVCDNASNDGTSAVIDDFAPRYPFCDMSAIQRTSEPTGILLKC